MYYQYLVMSMSEVCLCHVLIRHLAPGYFCHSCTTRLAVSDTGRVGHACPASI